VPPYVIFHDSVLREMAAARPTTLAAMGEIGGVGARKLEAFGDRFLEVIRQF
jgi:ATP-dependent DNA helicase RecQ